MTTAHKALSRMAAMPPSGENDRMPPLSMIECLGNVSAAALEAPGRTCRKASYAAGDIIGGPAAGEAMVAFVVSGKARVSTPPDRHGDVAFHDVKTNGVFGHLEALAEEPPRLSAVALSDSSIVFMAAEDFRALIDDHPSIALHILRTHALETISDTPRAPHQPGAGSHKLHAELLRMAEPIQDDAGALLISRLPRHRQLADLTGLSEADVAACLAELVKSGCAERRYPGLVILDAERLRDLAGE